MPWSAVGDIAGGLIGGSTDVPQSITQNGQQADQNWGQLMQDQMNLYNQGNPYSQGYQNAANQAGQQMSGLSGMATNYGNQIAQQGMNDYGASQYLQGAGQDLWNMALDPRNELYNRTAGQLTNQVNAGQALRGLGNSSTGAAEYNQAMGNFNMDWQNQQLQRALQGAQGMGNLYGQGLQYGQAGNQSLEQGLGVSSLAPGYTLAGGQMPYNTSQQITNNQLGQAQGLQNQIMPYLGQASGNQQTQYGNQSQQNMNLGGVVDTGISALGKLF